MQCFLHLVTHMDNIVLQYLIDNATSSAKFVITDWSITRHVWLSCLLKQLYSCDHTFGLWLSLKYNFSIWLNRYNYHLFRWLIFSVEYLFFENIWTHGQHCNVQLIIRHLYKCQVLGPLAFGQTSQKQVGRGTLLYNYLILGQWAILSYLKTMNS